MAQTPEQKRARQREWYRRNREKILARRRGYYEMNKDSIKDRRRKYYGEHRDEILAWHREYDARNHVQRTQYQREYKIRNRERLRLASLRDRHGSLAVEAWTGLWEAQGGRCYLCGRELGGLSTRQIHVDHDHSCCPRLRSCSRCRRGLACSDCNSAIGFAGDDPVRLRRMADALEAAQQGVSRRKAVAENEQLELGIPA